MTIQLIDLKVPNGDTPRSANTKINANFSDTTHAASKLVGAGAGQLSLNENLFKNTFGSVSQLSVSTDLNTILSGRATFQVSRVENAMPAAWTSTFSVLESHSTTNGSCQVAYATAKSEINYRASLDGLTWSPWARFYSTENTTKEAGTGYLVASSPVLKVQHDNFEKVHEAEQLGVEVENIKTGVYEISGTTGLREGDGWNLKPPKDVNGNVLCICEASEKDGVITLKTYKKKFDFETVSIVADYEQPTNIPEGATVMLRFNDLPLDDIQTNNP